MLAKHPRHDELRSAAARSTQARTATAATAHIGAPARTTNPAFAVVSAPAAEPVPDAGMEPVDVNLPLCPIPLKLAEEDWSGGATTAIFETLLQVACAFAEASPRVQSRNETAPFQYVKRKYLEEERR